MLLRTAFFALGFVLVVQCNEAIIKDVTIKEKLIRCNNNFITGKLDTLTPVVADITFEGHKFGMDQSRQFALERCFKLKESSEEEVHCGRVSDWYPLCGTSCGDSAASDDAYEFDGFVEFKYQDGTGFTELTVRMRPKQFFRGEKTEHSIPFETQTFRLMEKKVNGGTEVPVDGRTEGWEVQRRQLKECLGEVETITTTTASPRVTEIVRISEKGTPASTSHRSNFLTKFAFQDTKRFWVSEEGIPQSIWMQYPTPHIVARIGFTPAWNDAAPNGFDVVGSEDCDGTWTSLLYVSCMWPKDYHSVGFKSWVVPVEKRKPYRCIGLKISDLLYQKSVALKNLTLWEELWEEMSSRSSSPILASESASSWCQIFLGEKEERRGRRIRRNGVNHEP